MFAPAHGRTADRIARVVFLSAILSPLAACMLFARAPQDLDYSRTQASAAGVYRASIQPVGDSIPRNRLHSWTVTLATATGIPVDSARIEVDGGMPQHGHGLPTRPRARQVAAGEYLVEGMRFNMGGWWVLKLRVEQGGASDSVVFNLKL